MPYARFVDNNEQELKPIKTTHIDRSQVRFAILDLEALIEADHPARTIWDLCGQLNLKTFEAESKTKEGRAGRPCWPARLLVSVWVYSYTLGVASARAIERMMAYEPGLRWLSGDEAVNHHSLSDFRVGHEKALEELFAQFLAMLESAGAIDLKTILHDGTKMKAVAGGSSFHRRKTLQQRLRQARKVVKELDRRAAEAVEGVDERRQAAQQRAAREKLQRAQAAFEKLKELEAKASPKEIGSLRVSDSEPEACKMKHADGGHAPSYNLQVSTEGQLKVIVGIGVTTDANDLRQLEPALERIQNNTGKLPDQMLTDTGYATRHNVEYSSQQNVKLIAPWKDHESREAGACKRNGIEAEFGGSHFHRPGGGGKLICPAGKTLVVITQNKHHGVLRQVFEAQAADCARCRYRTSCCGERGGPRRVERVVESPAMKGFLARMKNKATREVYKKRCEIAEYPHLWMKAIRGWRRFSVRGVFKAGMEATWMALAYNVTQWMRLKRLQAAA